MHGLIYISDSAWWLACKLSLRHQSSSIKKLQSRVDSDKCDHIKPLIGIKGTRQIGIDLSAGTDVMGILFMTLWESRSCDKVMVGGTAMYCICVSMATLIHVTPIYGICVSMATLIHVTPMCCICVAMATLVHGNRQVDRHDCCR